MACYFAVLLNVLCLKAPIVQEPIVNKLSHLIWLLCKSYI